jgi:hypothetical protein
MDTVLAMLEARQVRMLGAEVAKNAMDAEGMRAALGARSVSGSAQAFLAGSEGLRAEAALDARPWRLSGAAETYAGNPTEVRLAFGRDLLDDTRRRMGSVDSLRAIRDRMARLRVSGIILGRLKEALALRLRHRRHLGEQEARARIAVWAAAIKADIAKVRDGGLLPGRLAADLELTLLENESLGQDAGRLADLDALAAETQLGLDGKAFASIDLDWLAARLAGSAVPGAYQDELDSLSLAERRILLNQQASGRKRLLIGPAFHFVAGEAADWKNVGLQMGVGYEFGRIIGAPALPSIPARQPRWEAWSALQKAPAQGSLEARIDDALAQSLRLAALEPATGYARINDLIRKKVAAALAALDVQESLGLHLVRVLERISQLHGEDCE